MKKAVRLYITGAMQGIFYRQFIKDHADSNDVKGFMRFLENGIAEIFLEGQSDNVNAMITICSKGPKYAQIRNIEQKEEKLQDFKEFKILRF
ncbi:acylphosphatase [Candidatus Pacearchaeota archaeon]|nr:acylphosphatase [Candidatus Pacearchaeota archaeon]